MKGKTRFERETRAEKIDVKLILNLLNKAIVSTSLKDKNDIIAKVQSIWSPQNEEFEKFRKLLAIRNDELSSIRKELVSATERKDELARNTAFVSCLDEVKRRHPKEQIIDDIKEIEEEIGEFNSVQFPAKLIEAEGIAREDSQMFALWDLHLHRLEELAYAYKKRLFVVEQSQDRTGEVIKEFGSINALVEKTKIFEQENKKLKEEERQYLNSPVAKRRRFGEMTQFCSREMALLFKKMLASERAILWALRDSGYEESSNDIDTLMNDNGFTTGPTEFDFQEFVNTTEPDVICSIVEKPDPEVKLQGLERLKTASHRQIEKIKVDIQTSKDNYVIPAEGSRSRMGKLMASNDKLLTKMTSIAETIDVHNVKVSEKARELMGMIEEREAVTLEYIHYMHQLRALMDTHVGLVKRTSLNWNILLNLFRFVTAFGNDMLSKDIDSPLAHLLRPQFHSITSKMQADADAAAAMTKALQATMRPEEKQGPEVITALEMQQMFTAKRKRKRQRGNKEKLPTSDSTGKIPAPAATEHLKKGQRIVKPSFVLAPERPRTEILHGLAVASDLAGFVEGVNKPFRGMYKEFIERFLADAKEAMKREMAQFEKPLNQELSQINMIANGMLVKDKENISVQTEPEQRDSIVTQTADTAFAKPPPTKAAKGRK